MNNRLVMHVDMDAFFTSVEQADHPQFRGRPVVVGGSKRRGVVAAASYEARQYGVRSAMPQAVARRLCPHAVYIPSRMARYREISAEVFALFDQFAEVVEAVSIDEAYLEWNDPSGWRPSAVERMARRIKSQISRQTGLTASVGVSHNKLLAKIASDYDKPDGLVIISDLEVERILDPLPVRRLPGLGPKMEEKLKSAGILTLHQLREADHHVLSELLGGDQAAHWIERASGVDDRPLKPTRIRRSLSQETTLDAYVTEPEPMRRMIQELGSEVANQLVDRGFWAKGVQIKIRSSGFSTITRSVTLDEPTRERDVIVQAALGLLHEWLRWRPSFAIRLLGVGVMLSEPLECDGQQS